MALENMMKTMIARMLNADQKSTVVCCNCFKFKATQDQQSDQQCRSSRSRTKRKRKKRSRKLKKSCLKTIVCVAKKVKGGGQCQDCACCGCGEKQSFDEDERFCSKCGQLLPGMKDLSQSMGLGDCMEKLEQCNRRQECNEIEPKDVYRTLDTGVQVNNERNKPMTVRIRVCPCPNGTKSHRNVIRSRSEPDMSTDTIPYEDCDAPSQFHPPNSVHLDDPSNWQVDVASLKKLALRMAMARLVENSACWDRAYASRLLRQDQDLDRNCEEADEDPSDSPENSRRRMLPKEAPCPPLDHGAGLPNSSNRMSLCTNQGQSRFVDLNADVSDYGQYYIPSPNMSMGCCSASGAYCYSPENPSQFGNHCQGTCTCSNGIQFMRNQQFIGSYADNSQFQYQPGQTYNASAGLNEEGIRRNHQGRAIQRSHMSPCR